MNTLMWIALIPTLVVGCNGADGDTNAHSGNIYRLTESTVLKKAQGEVAGLEHHAISGGCYLEAIPLSGRDYALLYTFDDCVIGGIRMNSDNPEGDRVNVTFPAQGDLVTEREPSGLCEGSCEDAGTETTTLHLDSSTLSIISEDNLTKLTAIYTRVTP